MSIALKIAPLIISCVALAWTALTWIKSDRDKRNLEKDLYKRHQWIDLKNEISKRRSELEDELAKFQEESEHSVGKDDFSIKVSTGYRAVLRRHQLLSASLKRAGKSSYVEEKDIWLQVMYEPIMDGDTVIDRTGNLINQARDESVEWSKRLSFVRDVNTEFESMIENIDTAVRLENIRLDPDKI